MGEFLFLVIVVLIFGTKPVEKPERGWLDDRPPETKENKK